MASETKITVGYNRKVQLDQYEPVTMWVETEVELDDGDDPDEVFDAQMDAAEDRVERALADRISQKKMEDD